VACRAGLDVKKAEVHGMSQRGGSVTSDVRFGDRVLSPMVPESEADFLLVLEETQVNPTRHMLRKHGRILVPSDINPAALPNPKTLNVAMLGLLSAYLDIPEPVWTATLKAALPERLHEMNLQAFRQGRTAADKKEKPNA
jgi:indolepyruvate ferredoxin oxidoreductase beta subunit